MAEVTNPEEIKKRIQESEDLILIKNERLDELNKPYILIESLIDTLKEREQRLKETEDESTKRRLQLQIDNLRNQIEKIRKKITSDVEKEIEQLRKDIEELRANIQELTVTLERLIIRSNQTVVEVIDMSRFFGGNSDNAGGLPRPVFGVGTATNMTITINEGEKVEYLRSVDSGNIYMKFSQLSYFENLNVTKTKVDYNDIFIMEGDSKLISEEEAPRVVRESDSGSVGSETIYISQTLNFQTVMNLNISLGFITTDVDRRDGDLSVWVLVSSNNRA